jgi:uncharacterized protein involved in copper resistance
MPRRLIPPLVALTLVGAAPLTWLAAPPAMAAPAPASWDGLSAIKAKKMDAVYLLPGADFRAYSKVMLDPTEVAFRKNWVRDYNSDTLDLSQRISDKEAQKMLDMVRAGFEEIFRKAYADAGYEVVTDSGPDVLRVRTAVANLYVSSPDRPTAARTRNYSREAGAATVVLEARDSQTGALLGRAVDGRTAGDTGPFIRNSVTNRADFKQLFRTWAKISVDGLAELKAMSPIAVPTETARK